MNLKSLFSQARSGAPLTPMQRAMLRLVEGLAAVALVAVLPVVASALSQSSPNWSDVAREALAAAGVAVALAVLKYAKAQGDPLLSTVADALAHDVPAPAQHAASPPAPAGSASPAENTPPASNPSQAVVAVATQLADGLAASLAQRAVGSQG